MKGLLSPTGSSPWRLSGGVVAVGLSMVLLACVSHTTTPYRVDVMGGMGRADPPAVRPPGPRLDVIEMSGGVAGSHYVLKLYRPNPCGGSQGPELGALAYISGTPGPKRWVVVLPIWGSSTYPPRKLVTWLTRGQEGIDTNVLWVQDPKRANLIDFPALEEASTPEEFLTVLSRSAACIGAAADDVRGWMDWVRHQPSADPRRVGIVGCSIGAIVGSLAMGRDGRFGAGVFAMGGGHLDEILSECYGAEADVRRHAAEAFGWSQEDFRREVAGPLAMVDPVAVAGNIDPADVLFIDAGKDSCIPASSRDDLWEAMGRPERVTLGYDHKTSFLSMTFLGLDETTRRMVRFLDSHLGPAAAPSAVGAGSAAAQAKAE